MTNLPLIPVVKIEGVVEGITYFNEENGYTVAKLISNADGSKITVIGTMPGLQVGETLQINGTWTTHPQFGRQVEVDQYVIRPPETKEAIERYLASGLLKGVGPVTANRIVEYFGEKSIEILDSNPERLLEIPNIGRKRAQLIVTGWQEHKQIRDIMLFLQQYGIGVSLAVKIYQQYGDQSIPILRKDPYQMVRDIHGIGFITADRIAIEMGVQPDSPGRIQAGLGYTLEMMSQEGHCYASQDELVNSCAKLLEISQEKCLQNVHLLLEKKWLVGDEQAIYLPYYYAAEQGVAENLFRLMKTDRDRLGILRAADWDSVFLWLGELSPVTLASQQLDAVKMTIVNKVSILTGGPGTGKSTITGSIIRLATSFGVSVLLAAPTGRPAKRLTETTGLEAVTIHRLLEYSPGGTLFKKNREKPLNTDLLIVDEISMADILLTNSLLDAVPDGVHVLFIGDQDQLPSVGPGNVLKDMIASGQIPITRLSQIFRQSETSYIIENAHRINKGEMPVFEKEAQDFFLFGMEDPQKTEDWVVDIVANRLKEKFDISPIEVQVLSPIYRGPAGVTSLNKRLQETINPIRRNKKEIKAGERTLREGDRVMQIRNNYDKQVFNGDIGRISIIDQEDQRVIVFYEDHQVEYEFNQLDEIQLAYAVSIHKSQGSEFPVVVIPVLTNHFIMLQRNLLYTAVTRAKRIVVLVGSRRAIAIAVRNNRTANRNTRLADLIIEKMN